MATAQELASLRDMVSEPDTTNGWTNERLEAVIAETLSGGATDLRAAAATIWERKAAGLTILSDTTESGSSRRNSQVFEHAMKMATLYGAKTEAEIAAQELRPRSTKMTRATRG